MSDGTKEQMKEQCERIASVLESLCDGMIYDSETGEILDKAPEDEDDEERYQSLYYYISDNLGIKIKTDLECSTIYSSEICMAWGGPNIYIDTGVGAVEGYWGCDQVSAYISKKVCDAIDNEIEELWSCYR